MGHKLVMDGNQEVDDLEHRLLLGFQAIGDSVAERLERHVSTVVAQQFNAQSCNDGQGAHRGKLSCSQLESLERMITRAMLPVLEAQRRLEQNASFPSCWGSVNEMQQQLAAAENGAPAMQDAPPAASDAAGASSCDAGSHEDDNAVHLSDADVTALSANGPKAVHSSHGHCTMTESVCRQILAIEESERAKATAIWFRWHHKWQALRAKVTEKEVPHSRFGAFVQGHKFESLCTTVILINGVFGWYAADVQRQTIGQPPDRFLQKVEMFFLMFYTLEISAKLFVYKYHFFFNDDMNWNWFDMVLVLQALYDEVAARLLRQQGSSMTFMRMLRLLKLGKVFRMLRALRAVRELRLMFNSVVESIVSMFWCLAMFTFFLYIFALVFMQGVIGVLQEEPKPVDMIEEKNLDVYFGSVSSTMLTLYMAASGGADWAEFYDVIGALGFMYQGIFLVYLVFTTFALLNILTGMLVEKVSSQSANDREDMLLEWRRKKKTEVANIKALCHEMDLNGNGRISWAELETQLRSEGAMAFLESLELRITDAQLFYTILRNLAGTPEVDIDMFVEGCMKMKGLASGMDQHALSYQVKVMMDRQVLLDKRISRTLEALSGYFRQQSLNSQRHSPDEKEAMTGGEADDEVRLPSPPHELLEQGVEDGSETFEEPAKSRL